MLSNRDAIPKILNKNIFETNTKAIGRVGCDSVAAAMQDKVVSEQIKAEDTEAPTFVRALIGPVARRIDDGQGDSDKTDVGTPLLDSDIRRFTDTDIESLAQKIATHNTWLFESFEDATQAVHTDEKDERILSIKQRTVQFSRSDGEQHSEYLVRAMRRYMTAKDRSEKELVNSLRKSDLRHVGSTIRKLFDKVASISRSLKPSYVDLYELTNRALEPVRRQHEEIFRAAVLLGNSSTSIVDIARANQHWQEMIDRATASSRMFSNATNTHRTWFRESMSIQDLAAQLQISTKLSLGDMTFRLTASERLLASVDFGAIRRSIILLEDSILPLRDSIHATTVSYGTLVDSIRTYSDITRLPRFVLSGATREVFVTSSAVGVLGISEEADVQQDPSEVQSVVAQVEEEVSICVALLRQVYPALVGAYAGARNALYGPNPDRTRHVLISLRELWSHLLRKDRA